MIQVVVMDKHKFINFYKNFEDHDHLGVACYVSASLENKKNEVVEVRRYKNSNVQESQGSTSGDKVSVTKST